MSWCWLEKEAEQGLWCGEVPHVNLVARPFETMSWELCFSCPAVGNAGTCLSLFFFSLRSALWESLSSLNEKLSGLLLRKAECNLETEQEFADVTYFYE